MYEIGFEDYIFGDGVTIIEWSDNISEILPKESIYIYIKKILLREKTIEIIVKGGRN